MDEQELKEIFKELEEQGWEPKPCNTEYTYYETPVMCGGPTGICDIITGTTMLPDGFMDIMEEFMARAKGDSMKDAFIFDGDLVKINTKAKYYDGDFVLVMIDGEVTLKTYCEDKEGKPWLVPQNAEYEAFTFEDYQDVRILGKVMYVLHQEPHANFRSCEKYINRAKVKAKEREAVSQLRVTQIVREMAKEITVARQWYAVFKPMMDAGVIKLWDYDEFCIMVREVVPQHKHLPSRLEMQRMAVGSFTKGVSEWSERDAPIKGKRFDSYRNIALMTKNMLEN